MGALSLSSQISLYVLLALIALLEVVTWAWQVMVLKGKSMSNPDGTSDDWHEQKILFGMAFADVFLACPAGLAGVALALGGSRLGFYLLAMVSFWFVWVNVVTTATSLRFEKPRITLAWLIVFPFGTLVGLAYIAWTLIHFDAVYLPLQ